LPFDFTSEQINSALNDFVKGIKVEQLVNNVTILELGRYRIRKLFK